MLSGYDNASVFGLYWTRYATHAAAAEQLWIFAEKYTEMLEKLHRNAAVSM